MAKRQLSFDQRQVVPLQFKFNVQNLDPKATASKITTAMMNRLLDTVSTGTAINLDRIAYKITNAVRKAYISGINFAARNMIGTSSPRGAMGTKEFTSNFFSRNTAGEVNVGKVPGGVVEWRSLSGPTIKEKGHNLFFINSHELKSKLAAMAPAIVDNTGVVTVKRQKLRNKAGYFAPGQSKTRITLGEVEIRLMPNISPSLLPGIGHNSLTNADQDKTQKFEAKVINDPDVLKKLKGPLGAPERQRPMLQPIFTFWTKYYIPNQIRKILLENIA